MSEIIVDMEAARRDLAAIFRWSARENMHEGIANHFSYAVSEDGQQFLMNPYGVHFSRMRASDLCCLMRERRQKIMVTSGSDSLVDSWAITAITHRRAVSCICIRIMQQR